MKTTVNILPTFIVLLTCIGMLRASGAQEAITELLKKPLELLGLPSEIIPILIMRPLSGSAANATVAELFTRDGPDSFAGRCASVIMGASDNIAYTLSVYFGYVGVSKTRHALPAAFLTFVFCAVLSVFLTEIFF